MLIITKALKFLSPTVSLNFFLTTTFYFIPLKKQEISHLSHVNVTKDPNSLGNSGLYMNY